MNKRNLKVLAALCLSITGAKAIADVFQTPVSLERGYAFNHYPFARADYEDCKDECKWLYVDIWGAGLHKTANFAFGNCDSTNKVPLSNLFFGASSFTVAQSFASSTPLPVPADPLLNILDLTPTFDYNEDMAIFGANIEKRVGCDEEWGLGFRARVPFRSIKMALDSCCALEGPTIVDLFAIDNERLNCPTCDPDPVGLEQTVRNVFAIRLDLASALFEQQSGVMPFSKFIVYGDGTTPPRGDTLIHGNDVTNFPQAAGTVQTPVYLIEMDGGAQPTPPFGLVQPTVINLPVLPANGIGAGTGAKYQFGTGVNYAAGIGLSPAVQKNYWLAPAINGQTVTGSDGTQSTELNLVKDATSIRNTLVELLQFHQINNGLSPIDFLIANGIVFDTARNNGIGNFDTEFYARYDGCLCDGAWFGEAIFGIRYPTDRRITTPGQLLLAPTGNNHHYEIKFGAYLGWQPCGWFAVKADAWYFWALSHKASFGAPFVGATIANIGPTICGEIAWQYFIGDIDFTFLIPCAGEYIGFDVGYQAWVKRKDHVCFNVTSATDFFGVTQPLNPGLLEANTHRVAHTVKAEIFKQCCNWQLFAGWSHTFAGENSLNDSDWYLGLIVTF